MKIFVLLLVVCVSCASAGHLGAHRVFGAESGVSSQFRSEDNYGNYQFGYDEAHHSGSSGRREERLGDVVRGSYNLADADGRHRTVHYVADASGFHASVDTNEPGVDAARDPADVLVNKGALVAAAPLAVPQPPAPLLAAGPLHLATKSYQPAPPGPAPEPIYQVPAPVLEAPAPRAFSYAFGASHPALSYAEPAHILAAPAPIYSQAVKY